ncbi:MAG: hypothetical protein FWD73_00140 [Polyangiaceae bacterium]|nr:hypothetical protein [Polyangiaceae bacterium]
MTGFVMPENERASATLGRARTSIPCARGFSALEIVNFLALAAMVSALGMYSVARYVRHAKTIEATSSLTSLAGAAAEFYENSDATQPAGASPQAVHAMRHFPPSSRVPVPEDPLSVRGKRYQSNMADWAASPWRDLHFSIVQPQCYQYSFDAQGAGASAKATVVAQGDLDGDGVRSMYSLSIEADPSMNAQVSKTIVRQDPEE